MTYLTVFLVFPTLMAFAAAYDLFTMKIPNWLTAAVALAFPVVATLVGFEWPTVARHAGAGVLILLIGMGMFALRWMGGGDAKLLAGIGMWFGLTSTLVDFLLVAAMAGGALTLLLLLMRRIPALPLFTTSWSWLQRLHDKKTGVPYGIALAIGALASYPNSTVAQSLLRLGG